MSLITSGLTIQIDFTNTSSLIIGGGSGVAILKATNLANPSLYFSGITGQLVQSDAQGFQNPVTLQYSGISVSQGGVGLTNQLGDYGTYTDYTTWFMYNLTGGTYVPFYNSDNPSNYLGQTNGVRWFQIDTFNPFNVTPDGLRTYTFYSDGSSCSPEPGYSGVTNQWVIGSTRVYQSGTSAVTEVWLNGVLTGQTIQTQTLRTFTDPIFQYQATNSGVAATEFLFYDRRLSDAEMSTTYNYFYNKYFQAPVVVTPTPTTTSTPTVTPTPSSSPISSPTPTATPTVTPTISVTPSNTPTPSVTPSISASAVPQVNINFKTIADDFKSMSNYHKQINSFGLGNIDGISYYTTSREGEDNPHAQPPIFPLLYVVPSQVTNDLKYKTWDFNTLVMDISQRDLANQTDTLSDTLQMLQDIISQFRLSVTQSEGLYNNKYYLDTEVNCIPFMEKQVDLTNGWNGLLSLKTMTPLNRCAAAFNTWTGTTIIHDTINLKTFHDDFRTLSEFHKQINSFGFGEESDLSFWTEMRDKTDNTHFNSPIFPLLYVIPGEVIQKFGFMEYTFTIIVMDIIQRDLENQIDVLSDTNQIMDDIISQFRLSVNDSLGNFNAKYYLQNPVICSPFIEQYSDLTGGWTAKIAVQVMNSLDRCDAAFNSWLTPTATATPTNTPTPSITPSETPTSTPTETPTATPTCPVTTQYLEVKLEDNTKFKLILWNQPNFTSPANANCDYIISGCAYGSLGTVYCAAETINSGQHQHQFNLAPVLLPGEIVVAFDVYSYTLSGCPCPVDLILPIGPTPTPTVTTTTTNTPTVTPTNTNTPTVTMTPTNTQTQTPSSSMTPTPSVTPTFTPTPSTTPAGGAAVWNTTNVDWNNQTGLWNTV